MFSHVKYPRFGGTNVPRDFVEYPSQFNEMWAVFPEVVKNYAKHYQTGEPMPQALMDKMLAARKFNQGYTTTEYLAASMLDQAWHQLKPGGGADGRAGVRGGGVEEGGGGLRARAAALPHPVFLALFGGGYSAGYYSYFWSEVLAADSEEWVSTHGGLTRENGDRIRRTLLSRGGSADALGLFRDLTGGAPDVGPLLRRRGLDGR